jgi:hypothetical protein
MIWYENVWQRVWSSDGLGEILKSHTSSRPKFGVIAGWNWTGRVGLLMPLDVNINKTTRFVVTTSDVEATRESLDPGSLRVVRW